MILETYLASATIIAIVVVAAIVVKTPAVA